MTIGRYQHTNRSILIIGAPVIIMSFL